MEHTERPFHRPAGPLAPNSRAVAFLDARYMRWLARLDEPDAPGAGLLPMSRDRLNELMQMSLGRALGRMQLLRLYWYTDADDRQVCNDQTLRLVSLDADGAALVRQMAADVQALAASGRIDAVLIGSDDDRLLQVIESAKQAGLSVCVLADERAQSMPRLMQQDPNWARLLREADRRVIVRGADLQHALRAGGSQGEASGEGSDEKLQAVVQAWWGDLTDDDRDGLREELPDQRGLPPEVDRDLLLRGKNAMGRALDFDEKRKLRLLAREAALGPQAETDSSAG